MAGPEDYHLVVDNVPGFGEVRDDCTVSGSSAICTDVVSRTAGIVVSTTVLTGPFNAPYKFEVASLPSKTDAPGNGAMGMRMGSVLAVVSAIGCAFAMAL